MKLLSYAQNINEAKTLIENNIVEIIVSCKELSRFHQNSFEELIELVLFIKKNNAEAILEWDILLTENLFDSSLKFFLKIPLHEFKKIRVQDPGAVHFIKSNYPWLLIQLILETGNHNIVGLKKWEEYLGKQLDRLILSNELSKDHLKAYAKELNTPIEVLVFGRILLFYSPRKLLSPLSNKISEMPYIEASGTSEESPHSGFPLIENAHGSFMFNVKDLSLIDHLDELAELKIAYGRLDLRFDESLKEIKDLKNYKGPRPLVKGFYNINKTNILFSKLKNKKTQRLDQNFLGVVVDVEKEKGIAILVKCKKFQRTSEMVFKIFTPDGKDKKLERFSLRNSQGETIETAKEGDLIICTFINGVTVKSQIYLA